MPTRLSIGPARCTNPPCRTHLNPTLGWLLPVALAAHLQLMRVTVPAQPHMVVHKITLHFLAGHSRPWLQSWWHGGHFLSIKSYSLIQSLETNPQLGPVSSGNGAGLSFFLNILKMLNIFIATSALYYSDVLTTDHPISLMPWYIAVDYVCLYSLAHNQHWITAEP